VTRQDLLIIPVAALLVALTATLLYATRFGRALRAVAQDPVGARLMGVLPTNIMAWTFALSGGMVALAALVLAPATVLTPDGWVTPLIKSFAVVVLGGTARLRGIVMASAALGIAETATALWLSSAATELVGLVVIACCMLFYPGGLVRHEA
jgi:branched-chain amino acid transport system permease protein